MQTSSSYQAQWIHVFRLQSKRWRLEDLTTQLASAKFEFTRLCSEYPCVQDEDQILWEFYSIEKELRRMGRAATLEKQCEWDLIGYINAPLDPLRLENCIARKNREAHWLQMAFKHSRAAALLSHPESSLIPQPPLEQLVAQQISALERDIARDTARVVRMYDWLESGALPKDAHEARMWFEAEASAAANGAWNMRYRIEELGEMLVGGEEERWKLRRCFDDPECP